MSDKLTEFRQKRLNFEASTIFSSSFVSASISSILSLTSGISLEIFSISVMFSRYFFLLTIFSKISRLFLTSLVMYFEARIGRMSLAVRKIWSIFLHMISLPMTFMASPLASLLFTDFLQTFNKWAAHTYTIIGGFFSCSLFIKKSNALSKYCLKVIRLKCKIAPLISARLKSQTMTGGAWRDFSA